MDADTCQMGFISPLTPCSGESVAKHSQKGRFECSLPESVVIKVDACIKRLREQWIMGQAYSIRAVEQRWQEAVKQLLLDQEFIESVEDYMGGDFFIVAFKPRK